MPQVDAGNPYQAPEASIAALQGELPRPPVYSAISLFCWALGSCHFLFLGGTLYVTAKAIGRLGWREALVQMAWPDPRPLVFVSTGILGTAAYLAAGRLLWARRGRPGLILCATGIAITYLAIWLIRPK